MNEINEDWLRRIYDVVLARRSMARRPLCNSWWWRLGDLLRSIEAADEASPTTRQRQEQAERDECPGAPGSYGEGR